MKKFLFLPLFILMLLSSCGKESNNRILKTIPINTTYVVIVDLDQIMKDLGSQEQNGKLMFGPELSGALEQSGYTVSEILEKFANHGLDFSGSLAMFEYRGQSIFTCFSRDSEVTINSYQTKFYTDGDIIYSNEGIYLKDNQIWFDQHNVLTPDIIRQFTELKNNENASKLSSAIKGGAAINSFANIEFISNILEYSSSWYSILNTLFGNPSYVNLAVSFEEGKMTAELNFLTNEFKKPKFALKAPKINMKDINEYSGRGRLFYAFSLTNGEANEFFNSFFNEYSSDNDFLESLQYIDGTIVGSIGPSSSGGSTFGLQIPFKKKDAAETFMNNIQTIGYLYDFTCELKDKKVYIHSYDMEGPDIQSIKRNFENSAAAFSFLNNYNGSYIFYDIPFEGGSIKMKSGNHPSFVVQIDTEKGKNSLIYFIENFDM